MNGLGLKLNKLVVIAQGCQRCFSFKIESNLSFFVFIFSEAIIKEIHLLNYTFISFFNKTSESLEIYFL